MTPDALASLHKLCFVTPAPWDAASFAGFLADPLAFLLVEGDAGFLLGRAVAGEAELLTLAVAPEARRRGLGRQRCTHRRGTAEVAQYVECERLHTGTSLWRNAQ